MTIIIIVGVSLFLSLKIVGPNTAVFGIMSFNLHSTSVEGSNDGDFTTAQL